MATVRKRPQLQTRLQRSLDFFARRQLEISVVPIFLILVLNAGTPPRTSLRFLHPLHIPSINPTVHLESIPSKFLYISYINPETGLCLKGADDAYLLVFWLLVWTAARETLMRYVWVPLARALGTRDEKAVERFAEQGWNVAYYLCSWTAGLYILWNSPYRTLQSRDLFEGYPHFALAPFTKFYYLVQIAFWVQQVLVLNIEKRRKDYVQMLTHHIVTLSLVVGSYATNFTRIGNAILTTMDFADIIFSAAKMLRYVGYQRACDAMFVLFVLSWLVTRHGLYTYLCYATFFGTRRYIPWKYDPAAGKFWTPLAFTLFNGALLTLQGLLFVWSYAIARVVWQVVAGKEATDTRSSDEDEPDEEDEDSSATATATGVHRNGSRPESEPDLRQRR